MKTEGNSVKNTHYKTMNQT